MDKQINRYSLIYMSRTGDEIQYKNGNKDETVKQKKEKERKKERKCCENSQWTQL